MTGFLGALQPYERVAFAYFALLAILARFSTASLWMKVVTTLASFGIAAGIFAIARSASPGVRAWLPLVYLVFGYWTPALLIDSRNIAFQQWLVETERLPFPAIRTPPWTVHVFEVAYLSCYLVVPSAFAVAWFLGSAADVERFWVSVLLAGYACYATIPWLGATPPRLLDHERPASGAIASLNAFVLEKVSHQLNTFPSGHVAIATAIAIALWPIHAVFGLAFGVLAIGIAVGAVSGGYHFRVDIYAGAIVGVAAGWLARYAH